MCRLCLPPRRSDGEGRGATVVGCHYRGRQLITLGATFDRWPNRKLRLGLEGAHSRPRILHAGGDRTGAMLVGCIAEIVSRHPLIDIFEHTEVTRLLKARERVVGVVAVQRGGPPFALAGPAVVLATGGVGQLFAVTTNPLSATGDGWALAHHAGAELRDLEFLQFHPTALKLPGVNPAPLISEAVRGAGATLVDRAGRRFVGYEAVQQAARGSQEEIVVEVHEPFDDALGAR